VVPEPPDYLNEAELHLFNKIKAALQPVGLKVGDTFVFFFFFSFLSILLVLSGMGGRVGMPCDVDWMANT